MSELLFLFCYWLEPLHNFSNYSCFSPSRPLSPIPHFADSPDKEFAERTIENAASERVSVTQDVSSTDSGVGNSIAENADQPDHLGSQTESSDENKWLDISAKDESECGQTPAASAPSSLTTSTVGLGGPVGMEPLPRDCSSNDLASWQQNNLTAIAQINADECGAPLQIFSKVSKILKTNFISFEKQN